MSDTHEHWCVQRFERTDDGWTRGPQQVVEYSPMHRIADLEARVAHLEGLRVELTKDADYWRRRVEELKKDV